MRTQEILVVLVLVLLAGCVWERIDYVYVRLTDPQGFEAASGMPPVRHYRGPQIPLTYRFEHAGHQVMATVTDEDYIPSLRITTTAPLDGVTSGDCATVIVHRQDAKVSWSYWRPPSTSCVHVGDRVSVMLDFADPVPDLEIHGRIEQAGRFTSVDSP